MFENVMEELPADQLCENSDNYRMQLKDLDGWFWPNKNYWRMLQEKYIAACQYIDHLRGTIARSGYAYYQRDAERMAEKWQDLNIQFGEYKRKVIEERAELERENRRLHIEIEYLQQQVDKYERVQRPQKNQNSFRDPKTGRYAKNTSVPESDKKRVAYTLSRNGWSNAQIAVKLNVSVDTVSRYIREIKAQREESERKIQEVRREEESIIYPIEA